MRICEAKMEMGSQPAFGTPRYCKRVATWRYWRPVCGGLLTRTGCVCDVHKRSMSGGLARFKRLPKAEAA